jgi:pyruvate dehydrogenase E1 component
LRRFFKVDKYHVVISALKSLADMDKVPYKKVSEAITKYGVNPDEPHALER